jgi:hypothetical protein
MTNTRRTEWVSFGVNIFEKERVKPSSSMENTQNTQPAIKYGLRRPKRDFELQSWGQASRNESTERYALIG